VQRFDLAATGSLLLIDWLTSGRAACGERWAFDRYRTETAIAVDGKPVARDAVLLDPLDGPVGAPHRMGRFDCLASVYLLGPLFAGAAAQLLARVGAMPVRRRAELIAAAGPLGNGGALLRVAGGGAERVGSFLRSQLADASGAFGADPWSRKF
jgi:urease accessory protein